MLVNGAVIGLLLALSDRGVEPPPPGAKPNVVRRMGTPGAQHRRPDRGGDVVSGTSSTQQRGLSAPAHPAAIPAARRPTGRAARRAWPAACLRLSLALAVGYGALAGGLVYWQVVQAQRLTDRPAQPARPGGGAARRRAARSTTATATSWRTTSAAQRRAAARVPVLRSRRRSSATAAASSARPASSDTYDAQLTGLVSLRPGDELLPQVPRPAVQPVRPATCRSTSSSSAWPPTCWATSAARSWPSSRRPAASWRWSAARPSTRTASSTRQTAGATWPTCASATTRRCSTARRRACTCPARCSRSSPPSPASARARSRPDTTFEDQPEEYDTGFLVEGFRIHDFPRRVQTDHPLDFYEATEVSSNIWYAHAGLETGADAHGRLCGARWASAQRIPFDLPTSPSQVNGGDGPLDGFRDEVELANAAYGQAEVLVTPLQMALVASTIANDGAADAAQARRRAARQRWHGDRSSSRRPGRR